MISQSGEVWFEIPNALSAISEQEEGDARTKVTRVVSLLEMKVMMMKIMRMILVMAVGMLMILSGAWSARLLAQLAIMSAD